MTNEARLHQARFGSIVQKGWRLIALLALTSACSQARVDPSASPTPPIVATNSPAQVEATPTPAPIQQVAFWADPQADPAIRQTVAELAQPDGLQVTDLPGLDGAALDGGTRLVVTAPATTDQADAVQALAQANPNLPFLVLGAAPTTGATPPANLIILSADTEQTGFVAGYVAALVTTQWRVAVLDRADLPQAAVLRDAFLNGATYFCGSCFYDGSLHLWYPLAVEINSAGEWQGAIDNLRGQGVFTVFIDPAIDTPEVQQAVAAAGMLFVTTKGLSGEALQSSWVATLGSDPLAALKTAWPDVLAGKNPAQTIPPVAVTAANPDLLTEGRMMLVDQTLQGIADGSIFTGTVPAE